MKITILLDMILRLAGDYGVVVTLEELVDNEVDTDDELLELELLELDVLTLEDELEVLKLVEELLELDVLVESEDVELLVLEVVRLDELVDTELVDDDELLVLTDEVLDDEDDVLRLEDEDEVLILEDELEDDELDEELDELELELVVVSISPPIPDLNANSDMLCNLRYHDVCLTRSGADIDSEEGPEGEHNLITIFYNTCCSSQNSSA